MTNKNLRTILITVGLVILGLLIWFFIWYAKDDAASEIETVPIETVAPSGD